MVCPSTYHNYINPNIKYLKEVRDFLDSTWHPNRCRFKVSKAQKLTGKLARLAEGANWGFHLLSHLYSSISFALAENKRLLLESSQEFQNIILSIQTGAFFTSCKDLTRHTSFAMKRTARLTHHSSYQDNINRTMRAENEFFCDNLKPDSGIEWETPIAHLIPRTPFATTIGDCSLEGAGDFSIALGFWWHIRFPDKIIQHTLLFKSDNKDGLLILINVLEFVTVIINYCAALHIFGTTNATEDPNRYSTSLAMRLHYPGHYIPARDRE
jgi:hypothetical protein